MEGMLSGVKKAVKKTSLRNPAQKLLNLYEDIRYPKGFHKITPQQGEFGTFKMYSPNNGLYQRRSVQGTLEPEVTEALSNHLSSGSCFWNIGGGWGYFALAAATKGADVYCFEAEDYRVRRIREAVDQNGFKNVTVIAGVVGDELDLEQYPVPDLILMDVEGWEYEILKYEEILIESEPTFIIEIHTSEEVMTPGNPTVAPKSVTAYLEDAGYLVSELSQRESQGQYHVLVEPKSTG